MSSIDNYLKRFDAMSVSEKSEHFRSDYRTDGEDWIEFLDFIDECKYFYANALDNTRKDFIFRYYALRQQKIKCGNHTHQFSADPTSAADIIIENPDKIDQSACWWFELSKHDDCLKNYDVKAQAFMLSSPEHSFLARAAALRLATTDGYPTPNISFDEFKEVWSLGPSKDHALRVISRSEPLHHIPLAIVDKLKEEKKNIEIEHRAIWDEKKREPRVIRTNTDVIEDHGFHLCMISSHKSKKILHAINKVRSFSSPKISGEDIALAIYHCDLCRKNSHKPTNLGMSPTGVYYAPPGSGKTTALEQGLFVGVDTDWLIHSSTYANVMKPFIDLDVPVLTNQYDLALQSGERFIGTFNPDILRHNEMGKPYTSLSEIVAAQKVMKNDIFIIYNDKYFSETLPMLFRVQYFYNASREKYFNKAKVPLPRRFKARDGLRSPSEFLTQVKNWSGSTNKKRRRSIAVLGAKLEL